MKLLPDHVIELARDRFPGGPPSDFEVRPIEKGGSGRKFFRVRGGDGASLIVVRYSDQREENRHYVDIARFLGGVGVNVPTIFHHDPAEGLIFMEDLGETDLWHFRDEPWEVRAPLYRSAVEQAVRLHARAAPALAHAPLHLQLEFDEQLYLWEQDYFFQNCLGGIFGMPPDEIAALASARPLKDIARRLAALPRVIVHRDFQSQNILIDRGSAWLIDFQGMRPGIPQYDLASLIYDPYVTLARTERDDLVGYYKSRADEVGLPVRPDFDEVLDLAAMQRLMQAMGAFGFLGLKAGHPHFLDHVGPARASLAGVCARVPGLEPIAGLLQTLPARTARP